MTIVEDMWAGLGQGAEVFLKGNGVDGRAVNDMAEVKIEVVGMLGYGEAGLGAIRIGQIADALALQVVGHGLGTGAHGQAGRGAGFSGPVGDEDLVAPEIE